MTISRNLSFLAQGASSTGVLGTANGGTNLTSFTVNAIPYASSSSVLNTSSALVFDGTNLGIGTSIPSSFGKLAVNTAALGSGQADGINLAVNGALRGGLLGTGTTYSYAGTAANSLWLYSASNPLYLGPDGATYVAVITNGTERMRVHSSGGVSIGNTTDPGATNLSVTGTGKYGTTVSVGAATPSASGAGITFPATQSASTDPNTLDDYEEGTWTPSLTFGGGSTGITYVAGYQNGTYTKIGNLVTVSCALYPSSIGTSTGTANITGLPFSVNSASGSSSAVAVFSYGITSTGTIGASVNLSNTYFDLYTTSAAGAVALLANTNFAAYCYINLTVSYRIA